MAIKKITLANGKHKYEVYLRKDKFSGKRIRRRFNKKSQAILFLDSFSKRSSQEESIDPCKLSLNHAFDYWLSEKGGTFTDGYFRVINPCRTRLLPKYGSEPISEFTPVYLRKIASSLQKDGISISTQNRYVSILCRVINFYFKEKKISYNPTEGYQKMKEVKKATRYWSKKYALEFLRRTKEKYLSSEKEWILYVYWISLETAIRGRELWALRVKDLDLDLSGFHIARQRKKDKSGFIPTKGKDIRFVPISNELKGSLENYIHELGLNQGELLFQTSVGTAINHDNFTSRVFVYDLLHTKVPKIRFHDLRHTAITLMVLKDINIVKVQKIAGHKNIKTTLRYIHVASKDVQNVCTSLGSF